MDEIEIDRDEYYRIPGYFSGAELQKVLDPEGETVIRPAGHHQDGFRLFEVYRRESSSSEAREGL
jgi:hypothetical protein